MADDLHHAPDFDDSAMLEQMVDATRITPGERNRFQRQLAAKSAKEEVAANLRVVAKLKPEDRERIDTWIAYWKRATRELDRPLDPMVAALKKPWVGGQGAHRKAGKQSSARFATFAAEPERIAALRGDHPALEEARTLFPSTDRLLVGGHNNAKLGRAVEKGRWAKAAIYHLTLEERATCPRSCPQWAGCYGNAMHMARRHDARSENFLDLLQAELWILARAHRQHGFVVRLHTLGDFYSVEYVDFWRDMLRKLQNLRVWGYTQNHPDAADPGERAIGQAIKALTDEKWDQFAVRFSNARREQSTVVIDAPDEAGDALICPAQHTADTEAATSSCATCGLCWADKFRGRTIAFLRHGMKARASNDLAKEEDEHG